MNDRPPDERGPRRPPGRSGDPDLFTDLPSDSGLGSSGRSPSRPPSRRSRRSVPAGTVAVSLLLGAVLGGGITYVATADDSTSTVVESADDAGNDPTSGDVSTSNTPEPDLTDPSGVPLSTPDTTAEGDPGEEGAASETVPAPGPSDPTARDWGAVASSLASHVRLPSDCGLPLDNPESLPNAARDYRGGVHEGIDFICAQRGRDAVAAMDGRILIANNSFLDPAPADRVEVLAIAKSLGYTPPWTLAMMFGRFVVIDHGVIDGAGHVVTIYAHFEEIDPSLRPGQLVTAGTRLGEIGNRGTETGATGGTRPQSIHLHWEIHVDGAFLGEGQNAADTRATYATLFSR